MRGRPPEVPLAGRRAANHETRARGDRWRFPHGDARIRGSGRTGVARRNRPRAVLEHANGVRGDPGSVEDRAVEQELEQERCSGGPAAETVIATSCPAKSKPPGGRAPIGPSAIVTVAAAGLVTDVSTGSAALGIAPVVIVPPAPTLPFAASFATVTSNDADDELPRVSLAVQTTVVVPVGNPEPEDGWQATGRAPSTTSFATGLG